MTIKARLLRTGAVSVLALLLAAPQAHSQTGLHVLTRLAVGAMASVSTTPYGVDIPDGNLREQALEVSRGINARIETPEGVAYRIGGSDAVMVDLDRLPADFLNALIATEDKRFLDHTGVDPLGTGRAILDWVNGSMRGGSGLTQQLIKNQIVGSNLTIDRKVAEAVLATRLEAASEKSEVLSAYLDSAWFGRGWGAGSAAQTWFGKPWSELTLSENAFLAGILRGPALYDPRNHPERAHERRDHVLRSMLREGFIDEDRFLLASDERLSVTTPEWSPATTGWVNTAVADTLRGSPLAAIARPRMDGDLPVIETTIYQEWQNIAQEALGDAITRIGTPVPFGRLDEEEMESLTSSAVRQKLEKSVPSHGALRAAVVLERAGSTVTVAVPEAEFSLDYEVHVAGSNGLQRGDIIGLDRKMEPAFKRSLEGAVVIMNVRTGALLASVGGLNPLVSGFDRTTAMRQPGSAIKPFVYLAALEYGLSSRDVISDTPVTFDGGYRPSNYGGERYGNLPLYSALAVSSNIVAVKLANEVGISNVGAVAEALGVYEGNFRPYLPSALGASETTLAKLAAGYAGIVNGGIRIEPHAVARVTRGHEQATYPLPSAERHFRYRSLEDLQSMMRSVVLRGTAARAFTDHPVSIIGKTGTSQDYRDALFVGVTPDIVVGVWLGKDDNLSMGKVLGGSHAAPIAAEILRTLHGRGLVDENGVRPGAYATTAWPPETISASTWAADSGPQWIEPAGPGAHWIEPGADTSSPARLRALGSRPTEVITTTLPRQTPRSSTGPGSSEGRSYFDSVNRNADLLGN